MVSDCVLLSKTSKETESVGEQISSRIVKAWNQDQDIPEYLRIYCLYGDLGAGKTTFTKGFAKGLGIGARLMSPTFLITRRYETSYPNRYLYHLDLYRLHQTQDMIGLGIKDMLDDAKSVMVIEWADKMNELLPQKRTDIYIDAHMNDSARNIRLLYHL